MKKRPNFIVLEADLIVGKWIVVHVFFTLISFLMGLAMVFIVPGDSGLKIALTVIAWGPLLSFMLVSKYLRISCVQYVQSRIPNDIEFSSTGDLFNQLAVRTNGCLGACATDDGVVVFEKFKTKKEADAVAVVVSHWAERVLAEQGDKYDA